MNKFITSNQNGLFKVTISNELVVDSELDGNYNLLPIKLFEKAEV